MDSSCHAVAWSPLQAAPALSALAGVLSGFVFAGMVVLLTERARGSAAVRIPAVMQFLAAFVALGLNSYLFAVISGEQANACRRIWSATAISSGMLAAGTVAAVGGIVLLVHAYVAAEQHTDGADRDGRPAAAQFDLLTSLLRGAFLLIAWMSALLMVARAGEALWVWLGRDMLSVLPVVVVGVLVTFFAGLAVAAWKPRVLRSRGSADPHVRRLFIGATVVVLYAVVGTVVVGTLLSVFNGNWGGVDAWLVWLVVIPALVLPGAAILLVSRGVVGLITAWSVPAGAPAPPAPAVSGPATASGPRPDSGRERHGPGRAGAARD